MKTCMTVVILTMILIFSSGVTPTARSAPEQAPTTAGAPAVNDAPPLEPLSRLGGYPGPVAIVEPYAYVGADTELVILNVSTPSRTWRVGSIVLPDTVRGITIDGNYAYVAADKAGLRIVDISAPAAPVEVGSFATNAVEDVVISRDATTNQAYVTTDKGLQIVDIVNPQAPATVGFYASGGILAIAVAGRYVYLWSGVSHPDGIGRFSVLDVANPQQPQLLEAIPLSFFGYRWGYITDMAVRDNYLYVSGYNTLEYSGYFFAVLDITNPSAPVLIGSYRVSQPYLNPDIDATLTLADHHAYVSDGKILDIADPANPTRVGSFNSAADIAATETYVYARDKSGALHILNCSDPTNPVIAGSYAMPGFIRDIAAAGYYAYTSDMGLSVIDTAKPDSPTTLGSYLGYRAERVAIVEQYAHLAFSYSLGPKTSARAFGLDVVNIANPRAPKQTGSLVLLNFPVEQFVYYPQALTVAAPYAYIGISNSVQIVDVANPAAPTARGVYTTTDGIASIALVEPDPAAAQRYAYVAANEAGLRIVDVTDPDAPAEVKGYTIADHDVTSVAVARPIAAPNRQYAYLGTQLGRLQVLDVTDPAAPVVLGGFDFPVEAAIHDIAVHGEYAYLATETGLTVVDITDPAVLALIDTAATPEPALNVAVMGNRVYVAAGDAGLFTFQHGAMIAGRVASRYGKTFPGVEIAVDNGLTAIPDATGFYATPALAEGAYTLTPSLPGYAFWPASRTRIVPPDARWQGFTVIPAPVTFAFTPGLTATLTVTDTQDLTMDVMFPENTLAQSMTMVLTPTLATGD
ncbi:MAG: hypothetical protein MI924_00110, partial [Chloroflexales bacterium]|nr:hypothetical protein [Chloroflexales bacterium]